MSNISGAKFLDDPFAIAIALGIPSIRIEVIRLFAEQSHATVSEVAALLGRTRNGIQPHLTALVTLGVLFWGAVRVPGSGRPTRRYQVERDRVEEIAWCVHDIVSLDGRESEAAA